MGLFGKLFSKNKDVAPVENVNTEVTGNDIIIAGEMIKEGDKPKEDPSVYYVLYVNKVSGFLEVPYNTVMLLVNDHSKNNLTINYLIDVENKITTISRSKIVDVTSNYRMNMEERENNITEDIKERLASFATFGGFPLKQVLKDKPNVNTNEEVFVNNKLDKNNYYEITLIYKNEEDENQRLMFTTIDNPEKFVNYLKSNIGK